MALRFHCTACGQCCYGQLPLTVSDAFKHADRFPLAMVWTPLRQGSKDFARVSHLGTTITLANRKALAVLIVPTAYIPPSLPCPALRDDNLCAIHANKPARCRTMPFYPYRDEQYQSELLTPQPGWACDTSESAPLVFADKKVLLREDFDAEYQALEEQIPLIQRYAEYMLKYTPQLVDSLAKASLKAKGGQVVSSLSSFLTATRNPLSQKIAQQQLPVLETYLAKTADQKPWADFHRHYQISVKEMGYLANRG